jgi:5-methylcytosine-specific restriction endonuclease McrA
MLSHVQDVVKGKTTIKKRRSRLWPELRKKFLKNNPRCQLCKGTKLLEVHHIKPFHLYPELELEESNLITLCESKKNGVNCHLFFGHLGNYRKENKNIINDINHFKNRIGKISTES